MILTWIFGPSGRGGIISLFTIIYASMHLDFPAYGKKQMKPWPVPADMVCPLPHPHKRSCMRMKNCVNLLSRLGHDKVNTVCKI
jgi:hypothetical protein